MLTTIFLLIAFLFLFIDSKKDVIDDKSDDDGSGSGLSGSCPLLFFEISVDRVYGMFSVNGVTKYGSRVSGIFSICIFSRSKPFLVSSPYFYI